MLSEERYQRQDWEAVLKQLKAAIPADYPGWTDFNLHDPGITILELFTWLAQMQMYHATRIGGQHWQKYVQLLQLEQRVRTPGYTLVTVAARAGRYLEAGTRFYAGHICFETREGQMVEEDIFRSFQTISAGGRYQLEGGWISAGKGISLQPFGANPEAGDCFIMELTRPLRAKVLHRLYLKTSRDCPVACRPVEERDYDGYGYYPLAELRMEYWTEAGWQSAEMNRDDTYGMIQDGSICFCLPAAMPTGGWKLRLVLSRSEYLAAPRITRISMAMVEVWQQETFENFATWTGNGLPDQRYELEDQRIVKADLMLLAESEMQPGRMERWQQVADFDQSEPEDCHYRLDEGFLFFGDGFHGKMPEGQICLERLVKSLGREGNIKAGTITGMATKEPLPVVNEWDVTGGENEETAQEAFLRYHEETENRIPLRCVSWLDYEKAVRQVSGLLIEDCHVYSQYPEKREIQIAVRPYSPDGCGSLNEAYQKNLYRYLEEKRLIGTKLKIVSPDYHLLEITCVVEARTAYREAAPMVEQEITTWVRQKKFGEEIRYGELKGYIGTLPCVRRVDSLWMDAGSRGKRNQQGDLLLPPGGLFILKRVTCSLAES